MNEQHFIQDPGYHYIVFSPEDAYTNEKEWPLILFLHGIGERGNDLNLVVRQGLPRMLKSRHTFPFIVAAPQCPEGEYWIPSMIDELIPLITRNFKIDEDRLYLTGISMGGYGTWMTSVNFPDRFAALAPICGGGDPGAVSAIRNLAVWAFHGAKDPIVPVSESEDMVKALKQAGGDVRFTVYPEGGHDVWTETYNNEALYQWFLSHNRRMREAARKVS